MEENVDTPDSLRKEQGNLTLAASSRSTQQETERLREKGHMLKCSALSTNLSK